MVLAAFRGGFSFKKILALIILGANIYVGYQIYKIEYRWRRANRRIWPILTHQHQLNSSRKSLADMIAEEQDSLKNVKSSLAKHLVSAVHGTEHHGAATADDRFKKLSRFQERFKNKGHSRATRDTINKALLSGKHYVIVAGEETFKQLNHCDKRQVVIRSSHNGKNSIEEIMQEIDDCGNYEIHPENISVLIGRMNLTEVEDPSSIEQLNISENHLWTLNEKVLTKLTNHKWCATHEIPVLVDCLVEKFTAAKQSGLKFKMYS